MKCKIDGCERDAMYKKKMVCQKHYFRFMRYGTYELTKKPRKYRYTHSSGYQLIYEPTHPLCNSTGYVYEHRKVVYGIYGDCIPNCQICGRNTSWEPYTTHVDHINRDKSDNRPSNLRVLCNACNSFRDNDFSNRVGVFTIDIDGIKKTAYQWAATDGATHTGSSIKRRISKGIKPKEAVFGENKTHPKKNSSKLTVRKSIYESIRENTQQLRPVMTDK